VLARTGREEFSMDVIISLLMSYRAKPTASSLQGIWDVSFEKKNIPHLRSAGATIVPRGDQGCDCGLSLLFANALVAPAETGDSELVAEMLEMTIPTLIPLEWFRQNPWTGPSDISPALLGFSFHRNPLPNTPTSSTTRRRASVACRTADVSHHSRL
jgi:hypothetical protein